MSSLYHVPHGRRFMMLLITVTTTLLIVLLLGVVGGAFAELGMGRLGTAFILISSLVGSAINIPVRRLRYETPVVLGRTIRFFGIEYRVPSITAEQSTTLLAINVGGAIVPTVVSLYLLRGVPRGAYVNVALAVFVVAVVTHLLARSVKGVGIITPMLLPPFTAATVALLFTPRLPAITAYVSGVLGTLIDADLANHGVFVG